MHFNTPKSKRRISIKKKRYTVNLSINLRGNVGNISLKFYCDSMWFRIDSFFSRDRCSFYLYIYKIQSFCHLIRSKLERRTNIYLNQLEVNFQPGSRVHQSLFSAAEQKMFLLLLKISSHLFDSLRPKKFR